MRRIFLALFFFIGLQAQAFVPFKFQLSNGSTLTNWGRGVIFDRNGFTASVVNGTISLDTIATGTVSLVNNGDGFLSVNNGTTSAVVRVVANSLTTGLIANGTLTSDDFANASFDINSNSFIGDAVKADGSSGLQLQTNGGTRVLMVGAGGSTAATAYGNWNFNGATANTIAYFGASKTLSSVDPSTSANLTELSYLKGVTSAIQTQINTKSSEANGGTMRSIQFTGDNGISFNVSSLSGNGGALRATFDSALIGGGTPGGSNTQIQFNDSSAFGGNGDLTFTKGTRTLALGTNAVVDINSTSVSIADTNITLDGATTNFTQTGATGTITMTPKANANFVVQQSQNGQVLFDNSSGSVVAILDSTSSYGDPSVTSIFGDAAIKFKENGTTQWAIGFKANGDTFRIDDSGLFANNRFVIKNDGNVGIGTATPAHKLSVAGTINATGNITGANLSGTNTGDQTITLTSDVTGSGTSSIATTIASNAVTSAKILNGTIATADIASSITLTTPNIGAATGTSLTTAGKIVAGTNINGTTFNATKLLASGSVNGSAANFTTVTTSGTATVNKLLSTNNINGTTANLSKILSSGNINGTAAVFSNGVSLILSNHLNGGTTETVDWKKANKHRVGLNGSTCNFDFLAPRNPGASLTLLLKQRKAGGGALATFDANVKYPGGTACTLTTTANGLDFMSCIWDGTNYNCQCSLDFR